MKITFLQLIFTIISLISSSFCLSLENVEYAYLPQGYSAFYFGKIIKILLNSISSFNLFWSNPFIFEARTNDNVRGIDIASNGDLLTMEGGRIKVYWWNQDDTISSQFLTANVGLNDKLFIDHQHSFL